MPSYTWVSIQTRRGEQHRYRDDTTGRYLPARAVRADLDRFVDRAGRESARALTEQLRDGRIALPEWQTAMARAVKNVNYAAVAAASGGVENMTAVERGRAVPRIVERPGFFVNASFCGEGSGTVQSGAVLPHCARRQGRCQRPSAG